MRKYHALQFISIGMSIAFTFLAIPAYGQSAPPEGCEGIHSENECLQFPGICAWLADSSQCLPAEDAEISCNIFADESSCTRSSGAGGVECVWDDQNDVCNEQTPAGLGAEARQLDEAEQKFELPVGVSGLNQLGTTDVRVLLGRMIKGLMGIIGSITLVMFIYGGIMWMTAAGNSDRQSKAMKIIIWSSLGVTVILTSYILVDFLFEAFR